MRRRLPRARRDRLAGFGGGESDERGGGAEVVEDVIKIRQVDGWLAVEVAVGEEEVCGSEVIEDDVEIGNVHFAVEVGVAEEGRGGCGFAGERIVGDALSAAEIAAGVKGVRGKGDLEEVEGVGIFGGIAVGGGGKSTDERIEEIPFGGGHGDAVEAFGDVDACVRASAAQGLGEQADGRCSGRGGN